MKQIVYLLQAEFAGWKNRKGYIWIIGIVLMLGLLSTFYHAFKKSEPSETALQVKTKISLGVSNEDDSEYAAMLISYFKDTEAFVASVEVIEDSKEVLREMLLKGELDVYLVVPPAFSKQLMAMEHIPMEAVISTSNPTKALIMKQVLSAYESYIKIVEVNCQALYERMKEDGFSRTDVNDANFDISMELIFQALDKDSFFRPKTVEREQEIPLLTVYLMQGLFFALLFVLLPSGMKLQKCKGMLKRMRTMRVSMLAVWCCQALPYLILCGIGVAGILSVFDVLTVWMFLRVYLIFTLFLTLFMLLGACLDKKKDYLFLCSVLLIMLAVLGGAMVPTEYLPDSFVSLAGKLPNYCFTQLLLFGREATVNVMPSVYGAVIVLLVSLCVLWMKHYGEEGFLCKRIRREV